MANTNFGKTTLIHAAYYKINKLKNVKQISNKNKFYYKPRVYGIHLVKNG